MLLLQRACDDLEKERQEREEDKERYLGEKLPPLQLSGLSLDELQVRLVLDYFFFFKQQNLRSQIQQIKMCPFLFLFFKETLQTATREN